MRHYVEEQVDDYADDYEMFENSEAIRDLVSQTEQGYLPEDLRLQLYGGEGSQKKDEQEKSRRKQILDKLDRKAKRDKDKQMVLEKNYMEKLRQSRELITTGTMVTQESGDGDMRPRKIKNQLITQLRADTIDKQKEVQVEQPKFKNYNEIDRFKNSPNNPFNMKGSVVAYLATDVLSKFYEDQEKKKKRDDEQQQRLKKSKNIKDSLQDPQSSIIQPQSLMTASTAISSTGLSQTSSQFRQNDFQRMQNGMSDELMDYIQKADPSIIDIKDEDIALEEAGKKRRYRFKKKKNQINDQQLNSQSDFESPDPRSQNNNQELLEDEGKRKMAKQILSEQNKVMLSRLKVSRVQEQPCDDVKDTDLFQYSYEESLDEDEVDDEEEDKNRRKMQFQEKIPMPKNFAQTQEGIVFNTLKDWVGDNHQSIVRRQKTLLNLFKISVQGRISLETWVPATDEFRWGPFKGLIQKNKVIKEAADQVNDDYEDNYAPRSIRLHPYLKINQSISARQIF